MKNILHFVVFVLLAIGLGGLGVALARPAWLPPWARLDPGPLLERLRSVTAGLAESEDGEDDDGRARDESDGDEDPWRLIRLVSPEVARRFGVETVPVFPQRIAHHLTANAETAYDAERSAEVIPRVAGRAPRGPGPSRTGREERGESWRSWTRPRSARPRPSTSQPVQPWSWPGPPTSGRSR